MNAPIALSQYLQDHPYIKIIKLHLDNDYIGKMPTKALVSSLSQEFNVSDEPPKIGNG